MKLTESINKLLENTSFIQDFLEKYEKFNIPFNKLKDNKVELSDAERQKVMDAKAVWHHGPNGEETPAVWKSNVKGKDYFVTHTHRAFNCCSTLESAIEQYHDFIKGTA